MQQGQGACPQPCSNPTKCFADGCQISCCSFAPGSPPLEAYQPPPPMPPPAPVPAPVPAQCPATCPASCLPQCDEDCCEDKDMDEPKPYAPAPVPQPSPDTPAVPIQGYTCPQSCAPACYPECSPQCCNTAPAPAPIPAAQDECSDHCSQVCGMECPQDCCDKKSGIKSHFGKHFLPPLNHAMANKAYMYRAKYGLSGHPTKVVHHPHVNRLPKPYVNEKRYPSYWQPYLKLAKSYFGTKRGSSRNTVATRTVKPPAAPRNVPHYKPPAHNTYNQRHPYYGRYQKSNYYGNGPGMRLVKDMKSKGAPVNVRYAYRYGNRLLVPIDLPKGMEFKEMKGRKFISVPAFKKNAIPKTSN